MTGQWSPVRLGQLLKRTEESIAIKPDAHHREITVRLWGKGVVRRRVIPGVEIAGARRFVARSGQFILSRIDARNGAFGLVPPELDGAVVSNDFPIFTINEHLLLPTFLEWFGRTGAFAEMCQRASEGTTNRVRLQENKFLNLEVALPPLMDQRRIVARIEELSAKIKEARRIRQEATDEAGAIGSSCLNASFASQATSMWPRCQLGDIADIRSGVTLGRRLIGKTISLPYLRVANVQDGHLDLSHVKEVEVLENETGKWALASGDLLLTEGGDWDKLGRVAIWRDQIHGCIHQNHIFRVRISEPDLLPEFVAALISSPLGKAYFQEASKQTTNLASINQRQLRAFQVFRPPMPVQRLIAKQFDAAKLAAARLIQLQHETAAELDALMPAILNRAFKGEL